MAAAAKPQYHHHVEVAAYPGAGTGLGVRATPAAEAVVRAGEVVVGVPYAAVLHPVAALADATVAAVLQRWDAPSPALAVVIKAALERRAGPASPYAAYLDSLPAAPPTALAAVLSDAEVAALAHALRPSALASALAPLRAATTAAVSTVADAAGLPAADVAWAAAMFTSRAMRIPYPAGAFGGPVQLPALVPGADFANHRPGALASFRAARGTRPASTRAAAALRTTLSAAASADHAHMWDAVGSTRTAAAAPAPPLRLEADGAAGMLELVAGRDYAAGEQVFIDYGATAGEERLLYYGFALPDEVALEVAVAAVEGAVTVVIASKYAPDPPGARRVLLLAGTPPADAIAAAGGVLGLGAVPAAAAAALRDALLATAATWQPSDDDCAVTGVAADLIAAARCWRAAVARLLADQAALCSDFD